MERLEGGANEMRGKLKQTHKLPGAKHGPDRWNHASNTFNEDATWSLGNAVSIGKNWEGKAERGKG
jgi:hypothetical protein